MTLDLKLTVLDQSPVHQGGVASQHLNAAQMSIDLAKTCDELGYSRYWVAEHHNSQQFAGASPEILITAIASVTRHMRIGSGGVMLSHYSPYKVAEVFNMLNALFPNRIDLGIGRAPGGGALASSALAWPSQPLDASVYPGQAATLKALLEQAMDQNHPWAELHLSPSVNYVPELWMLGSSGGSASLAGQLGMGLALARFISPDNCTPDIFDVYDRAWRDKGHSGKGSRLLAIGCFCAETQEEAELLASTAIYRKMRLQAEGDNDLLSPEEVQNRRRQFSASHEAEYVHLLNSYTVGTPERCNTEIAALARRFNCNEIALVTVTHDFNARKESYRLLMS